MRVSVRLQQNIWATALVMSLAVTQSPTMTFGQNQYEPSQSAASGSYTTLGDQAAPAAESQLDKARSALLKSRQALANSNTELASSILESAKQYSVDFKQIGDSPRTVQSMIDRQNQLADMMKAKDPAFNAAAASFFLKQAEALMYYRDFDTATALITEARRFPVEFNASTGNPDQLEKMIEVAKSNAAVAQTKTRPQRETVAASPTALPATPTKKSETMKFLSQAQLAIDQKKWNEAKYLVDQAKQLDVPKDQFASTEIQPWMLELTIQEGLSRQFDPAVVQTAFSNSPTTQAPAQVVQADYDPSSDTTANVTASADTSVFDSQTTSQMFNRIPKNANEYYRSGLQALDAGKPTEARSYFERAWENQAQLDDVTRQSLQDQLTRLTMSSNPVRQASSSMPVAAAPTQELDAIQSEQRSAFRSLQTEVFRDRVAAEKLLESKPREALNKMAMVRGRIAQSQLDPKGQKYLLNIIDRDLAEMQRYIDDNLSTIINQEENDSRKESVELRRQRRVDVETQLQKLVEEYNRLIDEQRFAEARVVASQAADLAPNNETVAVLMAKAQAAERYDAMTAIKNAKEKGFYDALRNADESAIPWDSDNTMLLGDAEAYRERAQRRLADLDARNGTQADQKIWNTLRSQRVQGEYRGTLAEAIDQLSRQAGVNIVFDDIALAAENIPKDRPIDMPIREPISLRSALEVILNSAGLVYVVENEVIKVTSEAARQSKLTPKTYYIGDLVMPMSTPQHPMQMNFMSPQMAGSGSGGLMNVSTSGANSQVGMAQQLGGNNPNNPFGGLNYGGGGSGGPQRGTPVYGTVGGNPQGGITEQDFLPLIELIQNTIKPDSWADTGQGLGTIEAFVPNLSLIVSQTQEIQDEIQDLLKKLRELNDVQIVVEVRFVSLNDQYFERIGIDFDFNINDNSAVIDPNADVPTGGSTVIGRSPTDSVPFTPTSDLDLQFLQGSFTAAEPIFGGFQAASAANFGFAILSDIEVFFLIQASKGDSRTNITQAPTVTMFNGQTASITDGASRPFVTSVIPVVGDFAVAHQPVITILPDGTNLNVTAVVSDDRRFVRLQMVPFFSQVTEVSTFTFDGQTTTERATNSVLDDLLDIVDGGANADAGNDELQTTTQGVTVQLPVLSITSISTVVSVPDGGTVLLGGIKRMREGRSEEGVPFLSNVPYINRLFKNVGVGQETSNLMMMVTPRIIIQKEIEEDQVGLISTDE
ncbi:MAG: hypothetical protein AB8B55_05925 [Mariniblastus sp.]